MNCGWDYCNNYTRQNYKDSFRQYVTAYKDSPAVLAWALGNENNLEYCSGYDIKCFYSLANEMAGVAYEVEGDMYHPVGIINGDLGGIGLQYLGTNDGTMNNTDFWGMNVYRGNSFGMLFTDYASLTQKPALITEYGIDALNDSSKTEYEDVQASWDSGLWDEIANSSVSIGGTLMAYSDEWWKAGNASNHDFGGYGSPNHPDDYSNEEWWGVMRTAKNGSGGPDIMQPRQVYYSLKAKWKTALAGDTNDDCNVNIFDLARVGLCFGGSPTGSCTTADVNVDGLINIFDLATVGLNYGQRC